MHTQPLFIIISLLFFLPSLISQNDDAPSRIPPNQTLLKSIFFGGGSSYIDAEQEAELQEFIFSVENINRYEVLVNSFTDNIGSREYNQWLSQQRSAAVIDILYDLEIDIDLILKADFGEDGPVYNNATYEGKMKNRRVDVILRPLSF